MSKFIYFFSLLIVFYGILPFFNHLMSVNETDAKIGEIPYQVSLQNQDFFHFCGGSILNDNYVITAARCVDGKEAHKIKVVTATIDLDDPKSQHDVKEIIVHEEYEPSNSWIHDIALLKIIPSLKKSAAIEHVPLPSKSHIVKINDSALVSGWGKLWKSAQSTNMLQRINIRIIDQDKCVHIYNFIRHKIHPTQICTHDPFQKDFCYSDIGGPLTVGGKLVGVVSWAAGDCDSTKYPTVYTHVVHYLDWIENNTV